MIIRTNKVTKKQPIPKKKEEETPIVVEEVKPVKVTKKKKKTDIFIDEEWENILKDENI